jgi:hypothetical protein
MYYNIKCDEFGCNGFAVYFSIKIRSFGIGDTYTTCRNHKNWTPYIFNGLWSKISKQDYIVFKVMES